MSFEFRLDESFRKGIRRIARKELEHARDQAASASARSYDEAVHEARKSFKKLRAILRLVRPTIGDKAYRYENVRLRDAGRPLTEVRDATILVETVDKVAKHLAERVRGRPFATVRERLRSHHTAVRKRVLEDEHAFSVVKTAAQDALERLHGWSRVRNRWSSVGDGIRQVYGRARRAFADATHDPTVAKLHEWRKQAKYLRYQLELLRPLWPDVMEEFAGQAARLGDLLGDHHDLAVLCEMLTTHPKRFGGARSSKPLLALSARRMQDLEQEAYVLGSRLFQESPKEFARRLEGYWTTWRKLGAS